MFDDFGKNLKAIREENNWTLEEMAEKLGTSKQVLNRYELGKRTPKISVAKSFADILGVPLVVLAGEDKPKQMEFTGSVRLPFDPNVSNTLNERVQKKRPVRYTTDAQPVPKAEDKMKEIEAKLFKVTPSDLEITPDQAKIYKAIGAMMKVDKETAVNLFTTLVDHGIL